MLFRPGKGRKVFGKPLLSVPNYDVSSLILSLPSTKSFPKSQAVFPNVLSMKATEKVGLPEFKGLTKEETIFEIQLRNYRNIKAELDQLNMINQLLNFLTVSLGAGAFDRAYAKTITTTSAKIVEESRKIRAIYVFNNDTSGANVVYISPNSTVTVSDGFPIIPGDRFEHILLPESSLYAVGDGDTEVRIAELTVVGLPSGQITGS